MNEEKRYALVRTPADSLPNALRMKDLGGVDLALACRQHNSYCKALEELGFSLMRLPREDRFPDSVFVEDPAIIINDVLITARLRDPKRQGEEPLLQEALTPYFTRVFRIDPPGFVEGGDVLITADHIYVGLSKRTNENGAEQLAKIARDELCLETTIFSIPESYLHLKGEATFHYADSSTNRPFLMVSEEIASHFYKTDDRLIITPAEERFGGNNISCNGLMFVHKGRPKTKALLKRAGFTTKEIDMSEFEKIDGAMTCLSKLFQV